MTRTIAPGFKQAVRAQWWLHHNFEDIFKRVVGAGSRRRRRNSGTRYRIQRVDLLLVLLSLIAASSDGLLFKRSRGGHSGWSKGKNLGREKVKEDVEWILEDTSEGGWKPVSDDGHVKVWKRSIPESEFMAIKSSATLLVSPQALFEVLTPGDIDIVRKYNPMVEDGIDVEVVDRDNKVSWSATMAIWPCRPRDFVTHIRRANLDDGSVAIINSATTHPKAPESARYVRGEILHGLFHIKPANNKKHSEFTMVHHFNPGGNVPAWLMNWLAEGKPMSFVRRLEDVAKQWDARAAEYKNDHRSMPCKGRGFADKPCAFLLSAKDVDELSNPLMRSWLDTSIRVLVLLTATLATVASVWYGGAAACRGWSHFLTDKGGSCLPDEDGNVAVANGGGVGGTNTFGKVVPPNRDCLGLNASAGEASTDDTSTDESPSLGACGVTIGGPGDGGVGNGERPVVSQEGEASGGMVAFDQVCVEPSVISAPNGEVGDITVFNATKVEVGMALLLPPPP